MHTVLKIGIVLGLLSFTFSCEKKVRTEEYLNAPFLANEAIAYNFPDPPAEIKKKILLEDFTGHKCGYCPRASKKIVEILNMPQYKDVVIPVAIYGSGPFNTFDPDADRFYYNFTTEEGIEVDKSFGVSDKSLPNGLVNRKEYENNRIVGYPKWINAIDHALDDNPVAWVDVYAKYIDNDNKYLTIDTRVKMLENYPNPINVNTILVENNIVNWQRDYSQDPKEVENYVHNQVLRYNNEIHNRNLFGAWGIEISPTQAGTDKIKRVTTTLNGTDWNVNNLYAISYIYDVQTKEVLQANKVKVSL